jgi:hypothetical protein
MILEVMADPEAESVEVPNVAGAPPAEDGAEERSDASTQALKSWFGTKMSDPDLGIQAQQVPSLIAAMEDLLLSAQSGKLKSKEERLRGQISSIAGE